MGTSAVSDEKPSLLDDFDPEARKRFQTDSDAVRGPWQMLRQLPAMVRLIMSLAYQANRTATVGLVSVVLGSAVCGVAALLSVRPLVGALFENGDTAGHLRRMLVAVAIAGGATAGRAALDDLAARYRADLLPRLKTLAEEHLQTAALEVELAAFDNVRWQDRLYQARAYGTKFAPRAFELLAQLLGWSARLASAVIVVAIISPLLALVLVLAALPEAWSALRAAHLARQGRYAAAALFRRVQLISELFAKPDAAAEIRVQTARPALLDRFRAMSRDAEREEMIAARAQAGAETLGRALGGLGMTATYGTLGLLYFAGTLTPASVATAVLAIRAGQSMIRSSITQTGYFFEAGAYVLDLYTFGRECNTRTYLTGGRPAPDRFDEIRMDNVTFGYPHVDRCALRGVSLAIRREQVVALVGENGSGKTTLAKLLAGLYRPQAGAIRWDGIDITEFDPQSLHERIAIVGQQSTRWPLTVRENIQIGRHDRWDPQEEALRQACRDADCEHMIENLPDGYDTVLSRMLRNGHDLSGGQWQRLSLARGFYRDAPLTIFDEPTSALDPHAEARILTDLARLRSDARTVVLITHRLAAARYCDRIVVLHGGQIAEDGTHDELVQARGRYAAMFEIQRAAYASSGEAECGGIRNALA